MQFNAVMVAHPSLSPNTYFKLYQKDPLKVSSLRGHILDFNMEKALVMLLVVFIKKLQNNLSKVKRGVVQNAEQLFNFCQNNMTIDSKESGKCEHTKRVLFMRKLSINQKLI